MFVADCTQLMSDCDALLASGSGPESYGSLLARLDDTMAELKALYPLWTRINDSQMLQAENLSRMAKELGIANHLSVTAYMLYHTVMICILQMRDSLDPSPSTAQLRNEAAMKIATCLELKEYEKREGVAESTTIGFVATKVAWQALGGFNTPEGRRLARVVRSAVNGVYRAPRDSTPDSSNISQPGMQGAVFAQWVETATSTSANGDLVVPRLYHLPRPETELINIGYKPSSALDFDASFSLDYTSKHL